MNTTKPAHIIRTDIANLNADIQSIQVHFEQMMKANTEAMMVNMVSEERSYHMERRSLKQKLTSAQIDCLISELQVIKDSVEDLF